MQPSYVLLTTTSYPKTVGGMCYAIIELTPIGLKQPLVTSQSQAGRLEKLIQHASVDMLSQHAVETNYMLGMSDTLSQHAKCRQAMQVCTAKYA